MLPFLNVSGDPNTEYLSDGIAESIIYSTSQLSDLKVIPRSSVFRYKGREIDPCPRRVMFVNARRRFAPRADRELKAALAQDSDRRPMLLDVCQPRDLSRRTDMLPGAQMHAPGALPRWIKDLPRDRPIAVYCICGFQISGKTVSELRRQGYDARAVVGGITAWHAIGGATVPMDLSTYEDLPQKT